MLRKSPRCSEAGCRNPAAGFGLCPAHWEVKVMAESLQRAEQRGFINGVKSASDDVISIASQYTAVPRHVLVQLARSWSEE